MSGGLSLCFSCAGLVDVVLDEVLACHVGRLLQSHDVEDRRSHIGKTAVLDSSRIVVCNVDERNWVQRVSRVRSAVSVDGIVSIAVVTQLSTA